ncbi:hypothetical protein GA0070608_0860 [Micromonospora peucetia]|uniref:Uncharacterized protein n=1 Tax=Micromonospora peucetia TaxID=47871 RepID=A0A1C6UBK8_9ACTN|nr:hypothetical protein GA0070608_0860 [Micromonospora peucetia]
MRNWGRLATAGSLFVGLASFSIPAQATEPPTAQAVQPGNWQVAEVGPAPTLPKPNSYGHVEPTLSGDVLFADEYQADIRCWNGSTLVQIPRPNVPASARYSAVGGVSCTNFFVFDRQAVPQRWHWNGTAWSNAAAGTKYPVGIIRAFGANNIWAFDTIIGEGLRFNGTTWQKVAMPTIQPDVLVGAATNNFWLLGTQSVSSSTKVAYRWNGSTWTQGTLPTTYTGFFHEAVEVSSSNLYVFGTNTAPGYLRFNGTAWVHEQMPGITKYVHGVAYGAGTVWVGTFNQFYRLTNGQWSEVTFPAVDNPYGLSIQDLATDPRSETVFAGGYVGFGEGVQYPTIIKNVPVN